MGIEGTSPGSAGETSALLILVCGLYLAVRRMMDWRIPLAVFAGALAVAVPLWLASPAIYPSPGFVLFSGGLMLGAMFMATDMVTSPLTRRGMLIFGVGCGVLTMVIRTVKSGAYPEGVSFAILIMNAFTPLINRATRNRVFGTIAKKPKARA